MTDIEERFASNVDFPRCVVWKMASPVWLVTQTEGSFDQPKGRDGDLIELLQDKTGYT